MKNKNTIIGYRNDRLGGRLSNLLNTWRIAKKTNARAVIFWPEPRKDVEQFYGPGYNVNNFIDLLSTYSNNEDNDLFIIDQEPDKIDNIPSLMTDPFLLESSKDGIDPTLIFSRNSTVFNNGYVLHRIKDEPKSKIKPELRELAKILVPNAKITEVYSSLLRECNPSKRIAIHYRRGDIGYNLSLHMNGSAPISKRIRQISKHTAFWFRKCAPLATYISLIETKIKPDQNIVIFSDEDGIADMFITKFGPDRIYSTQKFSKGLLPIQYVFLEMIFMSNCLDIISTKSGFSEVPSIMAGKQIKNIHEYSTLEQLADDYIETSGLGKFVNIPDEVTEVYGELGARHYSKHLRRTWTADDFRRELLASWTKKKRLI